MTTIPGNLIALANEGRFDLIIHGCKRQCTMGAGIAVRTPKSSVGTILLAGHPSYRNHSAGLKSKINCNPVRKVSA
jgi:hypothetical protein